MKKALVPLFILSLALNANAAEYTKVNTKPCIQGEIDRICDLNENPITGTVKYYYENRNLDAELNYKDGKLEGLSKLYYENGNLRVEENYKDGKLEGFKKVYYKNGNLLSELNYKNDKPEGLEKTYYENGDLKAEIIFKEGKPISGYEYNIHGNKTNIPDTHLHNVVKYLK